MQTTNRKPGRPKGRLSQANIRKQAIHLIENTLMDESISSELRLKAALKLLEERNS